MKFNNTLILFAALLMSSCQKDLDLQDASGAKQADESTYFTPSASYLASLDALGRKPELSTRSANCYWIDIPAGSTNALAQAVNDACAGGVIYLKSGVHTENNALTITKSVHIIGETGAVLKLKTALSPLDTAAGVIRLKPFLHFFNAPRSSVQDIDIQALNTEGGSAVLFENSNESAVMRCKFTKFQWSIWIEKSDRMCIMRNTIVSTSAWQTDPLLEAEGITIENGKSCYVADNDVSNSVFGIWPCDRYGTCERNYLHGNLMGIVLCNVPPAYVVPSGRVSGSLTPGNSWKTRNNKSTDNAAIGILVIDGANNNIVENNELARNGAYDIELTTNTYRFGFLTPLAYNNTVNAGNYPNIRIKDCGQNNQITGGIRVNTTTDPCN
jgi:nitrous oxidase accessory protein NosD